MAGWNGNLMYLEVGFFFGPVIREHATSVISVCLMLHKCLIHLIPSASAHGPVTDMRDML